MYPGCLVYAVKFITKRGVQHAQLHDRRARLFRDKQVCQSIDQFPTYYLRRDLRVLWSEVFVCC